MEGFNLRQNVGEQNELYREHPEKVDERMRRMNALDADLNRKM